MKKINTQATIDAQKDDSIKVFETPEQHILHRSGMYLGSSKLTTKEISIFKDNTFVNEEVEIIPAVAKLIDEVITNSADEHIRTLDKTLRGWTLNRIVVKLDKNGTLIVKDNGGISSKLHSSGKHNIEVIFGRLFSSSNYDDNEKREVVGTNGIGASLTNLFSTEFNVISCDGVNKVETTWYDNKSRQSEVTVTPLKQHWTQVTAKLELERFDIDEIPEGIIKYIEKACIIIAASNPELEIEFNDEVFKFKSFKEYVDLYGHGDKIIGEKNDDWEVYIVPSYDKPQRFAIVNGAECNEGTHVKHLDVIVTMRIAKTLEKLKMDSLITTHMIKQEYTTFIKMSVDKPEYSSQAKTELTNSMQKIDNSGNKYWITVTPKLTKEIKESFIVDSLKALFEERNDALKNKEVQRKAKELNNTSTKSIRKLLDANEKKSSKRKECELWIFEGDSAGQGFRPVRDPRTQGCYFLRGKCKNSINMSTIKVLSNESFANILVAIGLDVRNPNDLSKLRYGKIVISTDADVDGHSIVGQLLTLFAIHFPQLIHQGFIYRSISPLWRASKGKDIHYFFETSKYEQFTAKNKGYSSKYFKGLGSLEKKDYAIMINEPQLEQFSMGDECIELIVAFMGSDANKRKRLLESEV